MATYSVTGSKTATLVATIADTVTLTGGFRKIQVINHDGTSRISVRLNAGAATVDGDNTIPVPPGMVVTLYDRSQAGGSAMIDDADATVSLISAGTPTYTVVGF